MRKFRLYFDKDAETIWLNDMAQNGWAMIVFFLGSYTFAPCKKGEYIYQIDFTETFNHIDDSYRQMMNELGVEIVQLWGWWILLRKPAIDGPFELYTDAQSHINCYTKIRNLMAAIAFMEYCFSISLFNLALKGSSVAMLCFPLLLGFALLFTYHTGKTNRKIHRLRGKSE